MKRVVQRGGRPNPKQVGNIGEDAFVGALVGELAAHDRREIGDDCAAVELPGRRDVLQLLKTDCIIEGIHFREEDPPLWVGWKAACRCVSDIAASGGVPQHALVTLACRSQQTDVYWRQVYQGLAKAASRYHFRIVGGETSRTLGPAILSVAMTGIVHRKKHLRRSGARPGDQLYVTGHLGGSIRGKHLRFHPRVAEAQWLVAHFPLSAMMDLSDGLAADLPRLARASNAAYEINFRSIPRTPRCTPREALSDGEDYELLFALPEGHSDALLSAWKRRFPGLRLTAIGRLLPGDQASTDLGEGFEHFSS